MREGREEGGGEKEKGRREEGKERERAIDSEGGRDQITTEGWESDSTTHTIDKDTTKLKSSLINFTVTKTNLKSTTKNPLLHMIMPHDVHMTRPHDPFQGRTRCHAKAYIICNHYDSCKARRDRNKIRFHDKITH